LLSLSAEISRFTQQQSSSNQTIHDLAQKIGGCLAKRKLSLELNGTIDLGPIDYQGSDQLALLTDLTVNVDGLLLE
jgi:hypothetical protein